MITTILCLFRGHDNQILGHREPERTDEIEIELIRKCCRCGTVIVTHHRMDDPLIDESSRGIWSGYTWWLHKPLPPDPSPS